MNKKDSRLRRAKKTRLKIRQLDKNRLVIYRSNCHTYAQIITGDGAKVLASVSTLEKDIAKSISNGGNIDAAKVIGENIAKKALQAGVDVVAFDRSGFNYHGRVKALADSAREHGLKF